MSPPGRPARPALRLSLQFADASHRALLARGGLYARLWAHQSGGFLGEDADDDEPLPVNALP